MNADEVEAFVDELIRRAQPLRYRPTDFMHMRKNNGGRSVEVIEKLVKSGDVQSGFKKLKEIGLLEWSLESAVLKFPGRFSKDARECAAFRLNVLAKEI